MNTQVMQSIWRRLRRPSRTTLEELEKAGATIDYWPDYTPAKRGKQDRSQQTKPQLPVTI